MSEVNSIEVIKTDQEFINSQLKKYNVTDAALAEIRQRYGELAVHGPDDKAGYDAVKAAIADVRSIRTGIEKKRKELKDLALRYGRAVDDEAKRLTSEVSQIEERLKTEKERTDKEIEDKKNAAMLLRTQALIDAGFVFDGNFYYAGSVIIHPSKLMDYDDAAFDLAVTRGANEIENIRRAEAERQRQIEADRAELERLRALQSQQAPSPSQAQQIPQPQSIPAPAPIPSPQPIPQPKFSGGFGMPSQQQTGGWQAPVPEQVPVAEVRYDKGYVDGFVKCREQVLAILADPTPMTRALLRDRINELMP